MSMRSVASLVFLLAVCGACSSDGTSAPLEATAMDLVVLTDSVAASDSVPVTFVNNSDVDLAVGGCAIRIGYTGDWISQPNDGWLILCAETPPVIAVGEALTRSLDVLALRPAGEYQFRVTFCEYSDGRITNTCGEAISNSFVVH